MKKEVSHGAISIEVLVWEFLKGLVEEAGMRDQEGDELIIPANRKVCVQ